MQTMLPQEFLLLLRDAKFDSEFIEKNHSEEEKKEAKSETEDESKAQETIIEMLHRCKKNITTCQSFGHRQSKTLTDIVFVEFLELLTMSIQQNPLNMDASFQAIFSFTCLNIEKNLGIMTSDEDEKDKK
mmetsp:Transcript_22260/g.27215  ORF Transcript_22260/g.27215 Transcript_22260/m.27215 type:complete len:130 (-) Transcript_22260:185-574(-)